MQKEKLKENVIIAGKTLSIRINDDYYKFLNSLAKEERQDLSKKVRAFISSGKS
jgi:hypothetical protein